MHKSIDEWAKPAHSSFYDLLTIIRKVRYYGQQMYNILEQTGHQTVKIQTDLGSLLITRHADGREDWIAEARILACGKPTMTARSKNVSAPAVKYLRNFCPQVRAAFNRAAKFETARGIALDVHFKTLDPNLVGSHHGLKPDLTNILKGVEDALLIDDSQIAYQRTVKRWGLEDTMVISLFWVCYG